MQQPFLFFLVSLEEASCEKPQAKPGGIVAPLTSSLEEAECENVTHQAFSHSASSRLRFLFLPHPRLRLGLLILGPFEANWQRFCNSLFVFEF